MIGWRAEIPDHDRQPDPPDGVEVHVVEPEDLAEALSLLEERLSYYYPGADFDDTIEDVFVMDHLCNQEESEYNDRIAQRLGFDSYNDFSSWAWDNLKQFDKMLYYARKFKPEDEWIDELPEIEEEV